MPRIHNPTTLRSRNRVTNKTRLKIHRGDIDFDPDDAPISLSNDTAGVDADDANEHHLQAVLSAASQQNLGNNKKTTRGAADKPTTVSTAYIPTPDSTGIVDGFEEFYPPGKWVDPETYIRWSETVDDSVENGLTGTFTYYMDERDQDWLEKNNEEARGEGTSAQGAAASATPTRSGLSRSAKSKGKEPDVPQPFSITEDEFELVMGIFEKVTHDKTEFLHHSLDTGMAFPPFSDYQDIFAAPLAPALFANFTVPSWVPQPMHLSRIARALYPYWRERRTERGGHRIIPTLNGDETDTLNESYICFRRREIKAVRKTRASQVTSSDKLLRLQSELLSSLELAKNVLNRETLKRDAARQSQNVWDKRLALVDLKRKFPSLGVKEDEELLHDKERIPKRIKTDSALPGKLPGLKIRTNGDASPQTPAEVAIAPRQRTATIQSQIEREMSRLKDRDHHWEDQIDSVYQPRPVPYPQRLYKHISAAKASLPWSSRTSDDEDNERPPPAVRIRRGRGGRYHIDRRLPTSRLSLSKGPSYPFTFRHRLPSKGSDNEDSKEDEERMWRLSERWKFDDDDGPAVGPDGSEEQDRVLVDDYEPKYLRHFVTLLQDQDHQVLSTDPSISVMGPDGRMQSVLPYRLGMYPPMMRRDAQLGQRPNGMHFSAHMPNGTPISVQTQMKRMQPPAGVPQQQARISSGGGMRPPTTPVVASMSPTMQPQSSPPQVSPRPPSAQQQHPQSVNGVPNQSPTRPDAEAVKLEMSPTPIVPSQQHEPVPPLHAMSMPPPADTNSPGRPKSSQNHHLTVPMQNGYHVPVMNGYTAQTSQYTHHASPQHNGQHGAHHNGPHNGQQNGLSIQQIANIKATFTNTQLQPGQDLSAMHANNSRPLQNGYMAHPVQNNQHFGVQQLNAGSNMNLKLPPGRQAQWAAVPSPLQHNAALVNSGDVTMMNASMSPSPSLSHAMPGQGPIMRTPSANGSRNGVRVPSHMMGQAGQMGAMSMAMSPYLQSSPSPSHAQLQPTPPRPSPTPPMNMVSPSLQHQQMVGGGAQGY